MKNIEIDWTTEKNNKPYLNKNTGKYMLPISTKFVDTGNDVEFKRRKYITKKKGFLIFVKYFNKKLDKSLLSKSNIVDWELSIRPGCMGRLKFLIEFDSDILDTLEDKPIDFSFDNPATSTVTRTVTLPILGMGSRLKRLSTALMSLQSKIDAWPGSVSGTNLLQTASYLLKFNSRLRTFIKDNNINVIDSDSTIEMGFDRDFLIKYVLVSNSPSRPLMIGFDEFSNDIPNSDINTMGFIYYLYDIESSLKNKEHWSSILEQYSVPVPIIRPGKVKKTKVIDKLIKSKSDIDLENSIMSEADFRNKLFSEIENLQEFVGDNIINNIEDILDEIQSLEDVYSKILEKIEVKELISQILDNIKKNIPIVDFNKSFLEGILSNIELYDIKNKIFSLIDLDIKIKIEEEVYGYLINNGISIQTSIRLLEKIRYTDPELLSLESIIAIIISFLDKNSIIDVIIDIFDNNLIDYECIDVDLFNLFPGSINESIDLKNVLESISINEKIALFNNLDINVIQALLLCSDIESIKIKFDFNNILNKIPSLEIEKSKFIDSLLSNIDMQILIKNIGSLFPEIEIPSIEIKIPGIDLSIPTLPSFPALDFPDELPTSDFMGSLSANISSSIENILEGVVVDSTKNIIKEFIINVKNNDNDINNYGEKDVNTLIKNGSRDGIANSTGENEYKNKVMIEAARKSGIDISISDLDELISDISIGTTSIELKNLLEGNPSKSILEIILECSKDRGLDIDSKTKVVSLFKNLSDNIATIDIIEKSRLTPDYNKFGISSRKKEYTFDICLDDIELLKDSLKAKGTISNDLCNDQILRVKARQNKKIKGLVESLSNNIFNDLKIDIMEGPNRILKQDPDSLNFLTDKVIDTIFDGLQLSMLSDISSLDTSITTQTLKEQINGVDYFLPNDNSLSAEDKEALLKEKRDNPKIEFNVAPNYKEFGIDKYNISGENIHFQNIFKFPLPRNQEVYVEYGNRDVSISVSELTKRKKEYDFDIRDKLASIFYKKWALATGLNVDSDEITSLKIDYKTRLLENIVSSYLNKIAEDINKTNLFNFEELGEYVVSLEVLEDTIIRDDFFGTDKIKKSVGLSYKQRRQTESLLTNIFEKSAIEGVIRYILNSLLAEFIYKGCFSLSVFNIKDNNIFYIMISEMIANEIKNNSRVYSIIESNLLELIKDNKLVLENISDLFINKAIKSFIENDLNSIIEANKVALRANNNLSLDSNEYIISKIHKTDIWGKYGIGSEVDSGRYIESYNRFKASNSLPGESSEFFGTLGSDSRTLGDGFVLERYIEIDELNDDVVFNNRPKWRYGKIAIEDWANYLNSPSLRLSEAFKTEDYSNFFNNWKFGIRLSYVNSDNISVYGKNIQDSYRDIINSSNLSLDDLTYKEKAYIIYEKSNIALGGPSRDEFGFDVPIDVREDIVDVFLTPMIESTIDIKNVSLKEAMTPNFLMDMYLSVEDSLIKNIIDTNDFNILFKDCLNLDVINSAVTIHTIKSNTINYGIGESFITTMSSSETALEALINAREYRYEDSDLSSSGGPTKFQNNMSKSATSIVDKLIANTAKFIIKGIAEMTDPNIIIANGIVTASELAGEEFPGGIKAASLSLLPLNVYPPPIGIGPPLTPVGFAYLALDGVRTKEKKKKDKRSKNDKLILINTNDLTENDLIDEQNILILNTDLNT